MYPYMHEDAAFERLKDIQREVENSRLMAAALPGYASVVRTLLVDAWRYGVLAAWRLASRPEAPIQDRCEEESASGAA